MSAVCVCPCVCVCVRERETAHAPVVFCYLCVGSVQPSTQKPRRTKAKCSDLTCRFEM